MAKIDIEIDKLTRCIVNKVSGDEFATDLIKVSKTELSKLKRWKFDWVKQYRINEVYKLVLRDSPKVIQGLVGVIDKGDNIFVDLIESAPHNRGTKKVYEGVGGNLFAFACKLSIEKGYDGWVSFITKTSLKAYYARAFKAKSLGGQTMVLDEAAAKFLIETYYNK